MASVQELLKGIGLSEKEAVLYQILLRFGQRPITFLGAKARINRGLAYVLLHSLLEKGLVTKTTRGRVIHFAPLHPRHLVHYLDHKRQTIDGQKEQVEAMMSELAALTSPASGRPKMRFVDGAEGARSLLDTILRAKHKSVVAYLALGEAAGFLGGEYLQNFFVQLRKDRFSLSLLRTRGDEPEAGTEFLNRELKHHQSRFATHELMFSTSVFLFDEKVILLSSRQENFALLIESQEYCEMQKKAFDLVWASRAKTTIPIGVLHSLSGTMAISERSLVDGILMAVEEINHAGGVLGKRLDPIILDGASDPEVFARQAEVLIGTHGVSSIFGGWTSASRKTMKPVVEKYNHLLWYAVQFEGLEQSPNIIYTGAAPNQQVLPTIDWAVQHLGKKFFLVGSDYIFPRSAHEMMKGRIEELGGEIAGEAYEPLGSTRFKNVIEKIRKSHPQVILNTINGDGNIEFFRALRAAGISSDRCPTISFSIAEDEIGRMDPEDIAGDYAAWSYFQSHSSKKNESFVNNFRKNFGKFRVTDDPIETAYFSIYLFAAAAEKAGTDDVEAVRQAALGLSIEAPEGRIRIDADTQYAHRFARIGRLEKDGQFRVVWSSETTLKPDPFPKYKSKKEWQSFLEELNQSWGGRWEK